MATRSCVTRREPVECADGTGAVIASRTDAERDEQIAALNKSNPAPPKTPNELEEMYQEIKRQQAVPSLKVQLARAKRHGKEMAELATKATNERIKLEDQVRTDEPVRKKLKEDNELLQAHNKRLQELYQEKESQYNALVVQSTQLADGVYAIGDIADDVMRSTMATRMLMNDTESTESE